ncbi:MAG: O-antigen ligase family protein, partial [Endomicrobiia bacterium]|nr:O-antigen ligase family protein [Endomicrobiia bacterium]
MKTFSKKNILKLGFLVVAVSAPLSISGAVLGVTLTALAVIWSVAGGEKIFAPRDVASKKVFYAIAVFSALMVVSAFFSGDISSSLKRMATIAGYFALFVALAGFNDTSYLRKLVGIFIAVVAAHSIYGIIQYFSGLDIMRDGYVCRSRIIGVVGHFNCLASILGAAVPVVFSFLYFEKNPKKKILYGVSFVIISSALLLTFTRGAWAGVFAALSFMAFLKNRKIIVIPLILAVLALALPVSRTRIIGTFRNEESGRLIFWRTTPRMIMERPFFGWGADSFKKSFYSKYDDIMPEKGHFHPHNMYLSIAQQFGLVGLAAFLVLFYYLLSGLIRRFYTLKDGFPSAIVFGAIGAVVEFLTHGLVDEPFRGYFIPY